MFCENLLIVQGIYGTIGLFSDAGKICTGSALKKNSVTTKASVRKKRVSPDKLKCELRVCFLSYHKSYWHAIEANCFEFSLCMWWNDESRVSRSVLDDTNLPKWIDYVVNENKVISSHLGGVRAVASPEKKVSQLIVDRRKTFFFSRIVKFAQSSILKKNKTLVNVASFRLLRELLTGSETANCSCKQVSLVTSMQKT